MGTISGRSAAQGFGGGDGVRQQFTQKERDNETGLDYFNARYYSSTQGRFASADPLYFTARRLGDPQQFNLYSYVRNSPLTMIDPDGKDGVIDDPAHRDQVRRDFQRLAPGTKVDANGHVHKGNIFHRILNHLDGHGHGQALVSGIVNSSHTVHIAIGTAQGGDTDWDLHERLRNTRRGTCLDRAFHRGGLQSQATSLSPRPPAAGRV